MTDCPYCSRPSSAPVTVLSEHPTATGSTVWTRCPCGSLQVRVVDTGRVEVVLRRAPAAR